MTRSSVVGVLGGIGPLATADLYRKIIAATPARRDQEHLHVIIEGNPAIPDRTAALLEGGPDPVPLLISGAQRLQAAGADFIVMPCNTAHAFLPRVTPAVSIPFISMIDETARAVAAAVTPGASVGILATTGTIRANLYQEALARASLRPLTPSDAALRQVMTAIEAVKAGQTDRTATELALVGVRELIAQGAQAVLAACTELPLILTPSDLAVPLFDPTEILAAAAVREALDESDAAGIAHEGVASDAIRS